MNKGTYLLVCLHNHSATQPIRFGAAGNRAIPPGYLVYVGSAFGPGGFARISRHSDIAAGERDVRHWHIDYLLGQESISLETTYQFPGSANECQLAQSIRGDPIDGIGASDCPCNSHLFAIPSMASLASLVDRFDGTEFRPQ